MFENNIMNINPIKNNVNSENDAWGKRLYGLLDVTRRSN